MIISWSERERDVYYIHIYTYDVYIYIHMIYVYIYNVYMYMCVCVFHTYQIYPQHVLLKIHLSAPKPGRTGSTMVHHGPPFQQQIEVGEAPVHLKSSFRWHTPVGSQGNLSGAPLVRLCWIPLRLRVCKKEGDTKKYNAKSKKKKQPQGTLTYLGIPFPNKPAWKITMVDPLQG